ncbi:MAG: copper chaperone PCu(A)C [Hyphomicrobiaceae bacterium]|nr:copper chaperone PCu(A)C [Hyphomicrobiaceae bacterium]
MFFRSTTAAALLLTTVMGVSATAHEATKAGITAAHPWARATPGGASVSAAYLEIKAAPGADDRLLAISTSVAGKAEIHNHIEEAGVMKMRRVDGIDVKGGSSVVLKPSGHHIMLMDLKAPLKEGDLIKLTLQFQKAGSIDVEATVEPVGAMGPHGMDHQPGHEASKDSGHGGHASNPSDAGKGDKTQKGHH